MRNELAARRAVDPVLLSVARISTYRRDTNLTGASGFFFEHDTRLFLITSRHVLCDEISTHFPDQIKLDIHTDLANIAQTEEIPIRLYCGGNAVWREATDSAGTVDIAAIEIDRSVLPDGAAFRAFKQHNIADPSSNGFGVGTQLLMLGFPLGFHDTLHRLPVARQAIVASSYGLRFQGKGYFLTDGRTHRGMSGAPIVTLQQNHDEHSHNLPWDLVGVHSASFDIGDRDRFIDEALGLNCGWYADTIPKLIESDR